MKKFFLTLALACVTFLADAASVTLEWDQNPETDLTGYVLAYGTSSVDWTTLGEPPALALPLIAYPATQGTFTGLLEGSTYHFAVKAQNIYGLESEWSDVVSYTVPRTPPTKPARLRIKLVTTP